MLKEFRDFALKGNVIDLAVGVVIGAAFGKIVASFVDHILMPPLGLMIGKIDFSDLIVGPFKIGSFLNTTFDFLIIAAALFIVVRQINRLKTKKDQVDVPASPSPEEKLLTEIRDLLKKSA